MGDQPTKSGPIILQPLRDDDDTPVDNPSAALLAARLAAEKAAEVKRSVDGVREDMREYTKRDLDEHAEIRSEVRGVRGELTTLSGHVSDVRVEMRGVATQLTTFVQTVQEQKATATRQQANIEADGLSKKDHRRHLLVAGVGLIATVLGYLAHFLFSGM